MRRRRHHRRRVDEHARVHQLFTITVDASRDVEIVASESAAAILAKIRFWRATMRRKAGEHENFFIAKNRDSESTQRAFWWLPRVAMTSNGYHQVNE
jgi:hypothetical protein